MALQREERSQRPKVPAHNVLLVLEARVTETLGKANGPNNGWKNPLHHLLHIVIVIVIVTLLNVWIGNSGGRSSLSISICLQINYFNRCRQNLQRLLLIESSNFELFAQDGRDLGEMGNEQYSLPSLPFLWCFHDFDIFSSFLVKLQTVLVPSRLYLHSKANFSTYSSETNRPESIWIFCILVLTIPPQVAPSFSHDIHFSLYSGVTADCTGATRPLVQHFHLGFQWESCNLTSVIPPPPCQGSHQHFLLRQTNLSLLFLSPTLLLSEWFG